MLIRFRLRRNPQSAIEDREFRLDALRMGRAPSADFVIPDDSAQTVSWQHARIDATPDGAILHDLRSTNGTYLNGRRVEGPERLRIGDQIRFGQAGPSLEVMSLEAIVPRIPSPNEEQTYIPPPTQPEYERPRPTSAARSPLPVARHAPAGQMSATRALLVGMQKKQKKWMIFGIGGLMVAGIVIGIVLLRHEFRLDSIDEEIAKINKKFLDEETDLETIDSQRDGMTRGTKEHYDRVDTLNDKVKSGRAKGEVIYQRTVLSTAWVISDAFEGTGTVIDHEGKKLIVTSYHVVNGSRKIAIILPKFLNDKILANHGQYLRPGGSLPGDSIACTLWASDPGLDLAILEPIGMPDYVRPLAIAGSTVSPGADVHTIGGNPGGTNALWSYTRGSVRQVAGPVDMSFSTGQKVHATLVETQNPINHGDSGGPLVNNKCELVGVTAGAASGANLVARFIEVGHVKEVLAGKPQKNLQPKEAPKPPPVIPPRAKPPGAKTPVIPPRKPRPKLPLRDPPTAAGTIHILMLIDDCDDVRPKGGRGIADGVRVNEKMMMSLFANGLPTGKTRITTLKGKQANRTNIRNYYASLRAAANDTVMCYYAGHGCMEHKTNSHYFAMNGGGHVGPAHLVPRGEVLRQMKSSGGHLTVLISDCCSSWMDPPRRAGADTTEFGRGSYLVPLLLKHHGVVDIQAASPGEYGFSNSRYGGPFTRYFCQTCESGSYTDWDRVYQEARRRTVEDTRAWVPSHPEASKIGQKQQTPFRFATMNAIRD